MVSPSQYRHTAPFWHLKQGAAEATP
jgi:hypothetical protein